jgi:hypothetical protein
VGGSPLSSGLTSEFAQGTTDRIKLKLVLSFAMTKSNDTDVEGTAAFPSAPAATYRYVISLKSEKVNIWLEDRRSKKQW